MASNESPKYAIILGQEPDNYFDHIGFDPEQLFLGNISGFNLWDRTLSTSEIKDLANCKLKMEGNAISWKRYNFKIEKAKVYLFEDPAMFCSKKSIWIFFPGRRVEAEASLLCRSHGGEVVTPRNDDENKRAKEWYLKHKKNCYDELGDAVGWLGSKRNSNKNLSTERLENVIAFDYEKYKV